MADQAYKWTSNKDPFDSTSRIIVEGSLEDPKKDVLPGGTVTLTEDEYALYSQRFNLRKVDETSTEDDAAATASAASATQVEANNDQTSVAPDASASSARKR
jgi:hypothetical protein